MVCLRQGIDDHRELPDPAAGPRTVDVESDYDPTRFRPVFAKRFGRPIFF